MRKRIVCPVLALLGAAVACSDKGPATPSPAPTTCTFVVSVNGSQFGPDGGSATASVTAPAQCAWSASSAVDWVKIQGAVSSSGNGSVPLLVAAMDGTSERAATITIAQSAFTLTQSGCVVRLSASDVRLPASGASSDCTIDTQASCSWRVEGDLSWAAFDPQAGRGAATTHVRAAGNHASSRQVDVRVGTQPLTVHQDGPIDLPSPPPAPATCSYAVTSPLDVLIPFRGMVGRAEIQTGSSCSWTAMTTQPWARIRGVNSGRGPALIEYEVDFNRATYQPGFRKAAIEIRWPSPTEGQNVWLSQFADCGTALSTYPDGQAANPLSFDASGGEKNLLHLVEPAFTCAWRLEGGADWVETRPARGLVLQGDKDFIVKVPPNPSAQSRTTVLSVGEHGITIVQAGR